MKRKKKPHTPSCTLELPSWKEQAPIHLSDPFDALSTWWALSFASTMMALSRQLIQIQEHPLACHFLPHDHVRFRVPVQLIV